jgi:nitrite reductase/ring-hydroxylating ferredoxin subunit
MSLVFHALASMSDVAVNSAINVTVGDREIAVFNLDGAFYALGGICTHGMARLADGYIEGELIECPKHAGTFEIKTGIAIDYPCTVNTKSYELRVEGETILVGIDAPE